MSQAYECEIVLRVFDLYRQTKQQDIMKTGPITDRCSRTQ